MPITLTPFAVQKKWEGCTWTVPSIDVLAHAIAIIAVGQAKHVAAIMHAAGLKPLPTTKGAVRSAQRLLSASADTAHRDGWMFQLMSWLAVQVRAPGVLMNAPHLIHAHKGLDGLQVSFDAAGKVSAVVIFEDKATTSPRPTVRDKVWPDFRLLETGDNENFVAAEVTQLLTNAGHGNPQLAVSEIMWSAVRRYRVSVTDNQSTEGSQAALFKGYEECVPGEIERRRAEVFEVRHLRPWMAELALAATAHTASFDTKD